MRARVRAVGVGGTARRLAALIKWIGPPVVHASAAATRKVLPARSQAVTAVRVREIRRNII